MLTKHKIKHECKRFLQILKEIEPLFRTIEVLFVIWGVVIVSSRANEIAEKQLALDMLVIQPEFKVVQSVEDSYLEDFKMTNSVISISSLHGTYKEINVDTVSFLGISYICDGEYKNKTVEVCDYYKAQSHDMFDNERKIKIFGIYNYTWYTELLKEILGCKDIDFQAIYIDTYVKIEYVDIVNEKHVNYYRMTSKEGVIINEKEGEIIFETKPIYVKDFCMKELTLDKMLELVE